MASKEAVRHDRLASHHHRKSNIIGGRRLVNGGRLSLIDWHRVVVNVSASSRIQDEAAERPASGRLTHMRQTTADTGFGAVPQGDLTPRRASVFSNLGSSLIFFSIHISSLKGAD